MTRCRGRECGMRRKFKRCREGFQCFGQRSPRGLGTTTVPCVFSRRRRSSEGQSCKPTPGRWVSRGQSSASEAGQSAEPGTAHHLQACPSTGGSACWCRRSCYDTSMAKFRTQNSHRIINLLSLPQFRNVHTDPPYALLHFAPPKCSSARRQNPNSAHSLPGSPTPASNGSCMPSKHVNCLPCLDKALGSTRSSTG
jgi:hypothetical protein